MTDKLKAQVSAFLDDELLEQESELLVRRLCNDDELRQTALRYTLIGDAMRGSLQQIDAGLAGNIRRVIDEEPDAAAAQGEATAASTGTFGRALGGGAIAAAVAAVALFAVQQARGPVPGDTTVAGSEPAETPIVVPLDSAAPGDPFTGAAPAPVSQAGLQNRMNRYLIRHNRFATTTGRQGVLTYLSMGASDVAQEQDREREDAGAEAVDALPAGADGP